MTHKFKYLIVDDTTTRLITEDRTLVPVFEREHFNVYKWNSRAKWFNTHAEAISHKIAMQNFEPTWGDLKVIEFLD